MHCIHFFYHDKKVGHTTEIERIKLCLERIRTIGKTDEKRLFANETWYYMRMLKIIWIEHVTCEEIF